MSPPQPRVAYDGIVRFLETQYGLVINEEKRDKLEAFFSSAEAPRHSSSQDLMTLFKSDPEQLQLLISTITVSETYFFRFPEQFNFLESILFEPDSLAGRLGRNLRIWSAGCATGEEPYSLAMMLAQHGHLAKAEILASDISENSLRKARRAHYSSWSLRDQGKVRAHDYLVKTEQGYEVKPSIREAAKFVLHNLADFREQNYPSMFNNMDLILCRNVLIYLEASSVRKVVERLVDCLLPGGYLITAAADPVPDNLPVHYLHVDNVGLVLQKPTFSAPLITTPEESALVSRSTVPYSLLQGTEEPKKLTKKVLSVRKEAVDSTTIDNSSQLILTDLLSRGENEQAIALLKKLLDKDSENVALHYKFAILMMSVKRYGGAREALRRVLYLNNELAEAHFTLGTILTRLNDFSGAKRSLMRALYLLMRLPLQHKLPLSNDFLAGQLLAATRHELEKLQYQKIQESV